MSRRIPLTQGKFAIVEDEDFEWLNQWKWYAVKGGHTFYAARHTFSKTDKQKIILMHREILNTPLRMDSDHINSNGLDNRRRNLRICTRQQNNMNQKKLGEYSSQYKGVCWHKKAKKWQAQIEYGGIHYYLGLFNNEKNAAVAYDVAAIKHFGEFARLNIIGA